METHYLGGYYLIKTVPIEYWDGKNTVIRSCSGCFNIHAFDIWHSTWLNEKNSQERIDLNITDEQIEGIKKWSHEKFPYGSNVLPDLKTALEFKELFFKSRNDIQIYSMNFSETDTDLLISQFSEMNKPKYFDYGLEDFELRQNLIKKVEESNNTNEDLLGYDFIGVEANGDFHTFNCHCIAEILINKFDLKLNEFGLFEQPHDPNSIREYLNLPNAPVEQVPWYIAKVKLVKNTIV